MNKNKFKYDNLGMLRNNYHRNSLPEKLDLSYQELQLHATQAEKICKRLFRYMEKHIFSYSTKISKLKYDINPSENNMQKNILRCQKKIKILMIKLQNNMSLLQKKSKNLMNGSDKLNKLINILLLKIEIIKDLQTIIKQIYNILNK